MTGKKHALGAWGEFEAAKFLENLGYTILDRNWRYGHLELDLVCFKQGELIFAEVKTRSESSQETPYEALTPAKKNNLLRAAQAYLSEKNAWEMPCRFDLICVDKMKTAFSVEHVINAFEFTDSPRTLDSCNTTWQPW